ncbi:WPP domain-associated protein-like isoform X2 [Hordeum vulgare subsp. vulgare]|uniref:WPP domain-associated protein n=1 Tax=Hordeum vulgare subsp. vulgare TaxID=112509 RepID=A0A8I6XLH8_HORVV|nr:WPP domain-associated protein-like isoform X2 [Hordeum vulgare subsp. vulgare]XP_044975594.1 WPP domain-associated protein-like isoform X2 [Hordeum vulgare subsp. vulgare]
MAEILDVPISGTNGSATVQAEQSLSVPLRDTNGSASVHGEESLDVPVSDTNGSATVQDETSSEGNELIIVDEMDSLWDDVNTMVDISTFVTYSVIKGFVKDAEQEIGQQLASKDEEIRLLNQKLMQLGNGSLSLSGGRDRKYDEVYSIRQQLHAISKSLLNSEWGLSGSQYNFDGADDVSKLRDNEHSSRNGSAKVESAGASPDAAFADASCLKHLDRDALIAHFNKEMNTMKRMHDKVVEMKTEEIFALKRNLLNKEGSNPWHLRNNKEFEQIRKKIGEVMTRLDGLLMENNKRTTSGVKAETFAGQQDKKNVLDSEIQQIQGAATNNQVEVCAFPTQASHIASIEADHAKKIGMLESDIEEARMATMIREEIEMIVLREFVNEIEIRLHGNEMEHNMKQDICSVIQNEAVAEAVLNLNSTLLKYNEEKSCSEAASTIQKQEIENLKRAVDSFSKVVREKEECQIELGAMKGHMDLLSHQLDLLKVKVEKQDSCISEKNKEFDMIVGRVEQALQHVRQNEINMSEFHDRFRNATDSLKEVEKQNHYLCKVIEEKEKIFTSTIYKEKEFKEHMTSLVESMREFENLVTDQQAIIANKVQHSESRFCLLKDQCKHLMKEGNLLRRKALRYKEISETRGSNLQKAELEVDLLGDEVEALTDLLAKIYIALDHYSPVLQHYTGVMETLNMIKKHISTAK